MWLPTNYGNLLIDRYSTGIQCTVWYTGACKLKSDHTVGYTGACKLKSDHTVGYTGQNVQMVCFKQNSIQR
jgi:hypothetical protein